MSIPRRKSSLLLPKLRYQAFWREFKIFLDTVISELQNLNIDEYQLKQNIRGLVEFEQMIALNYR